MNSINKTFLSSNKCNQIQTVL